MTAYGSYIVETRCDSIWIGERHRRDMGDLEVLAATIAAHAERGDRHRAAAHGGAVRSWADL